MVDQKGATVPELERDPQNPPAVVGADALDEILAELVGALDNVRVVLTTAKIALQNMDRGGELSLAVRGLENYSALICQRLSRRPD